MRAARLDDSWSITLGIMNPVRRARMAATFILSCHFLDS
jgi:hypothetical protein